MTNQIKTEYSLRIGNLLFLSLAPITTLADRGIYTDLLREFRSRGWRVYVLSPADKLETDESELIEEEGCCIARVETGRIQKTNVVEKGMNTLLIARRFIKAIKQRFSGVCFDLVLYPTPPITLAGVVDYVKKRDGAFAYLMLKDIFPQNSVDLGILSLHGVKKPLYDYFRSQERRLYSLSDRIGCMSPATADYLLAHNLDVDPATVEICPNSVEPWDARVSLDERLSLRARYGIPEDKFVFVYGGNLGVPQDIPHLIECLESQAGNSEAFFLVVGDGTEYGKLEEYIKEKRPSNVRLMQRLPKDDYDRMVGSCDIGLIFLDRRFTIPNFPSRLLSYLEAHMPVLAVTDSCTDVGAVAEEGGFGWSCTDGSVEEFSACVERALRADREAMGERGWEYLLANYTVAQAYETITAHLGLEDLS